MQYDAWCSPSWPCLFEPYNQRESFVPRKALCRAPADICRQSTPNGIHVTNVGSQTMLGISSSLSSSSSSEATRPSAPSLFQPQDITDPSLSKATTAIYVDEIWDGKFCLYLENANRQLLYLLLDWINNRYVSVLNTVQDRRDLMHHEDHCPKSIDDHRQVERVHVLATSEFNNFRFKRPMSIV
jgi:hypothetical protein